MSESPSTQLQLEAPGLASAAAETVTPPPPRSSSKVLQVGGVSVKLDSLGPMLVNTDGTLSRVANWGDLTEAEQTRTTRVLAARNKLRLEKQDFNESKDSQSDSLSILQSSDEKFK